MTSLKLHSADDPQGVSKPPYRLTRRVNAAGVVLMSSMAAVAIILAGEWAIASLDLGPLSRHMGLHILIMNVAAPVISYALIRHGLPEGYRPIHFAIAVALQVFLLWFWHAPALMSAAHANAPVMFAMHFSLLLAAVGFWACIYGTNPYNRWQSIFALLLTGKLFCLLAAILTFAPRPLYPELSSHGSHAMTSATALADQQLAGLLMIVACPLTYVVAGTVIAARWLIDVERRAAEHQLSGKFPLEAA